MEFLDALSLVVLVLIFLTPILVWMWIKSEERQENVRRDGEIYQRPRRKSSRGR